MSILSKFSNKNGAVICCVGAAVSLYAVYCRQQNQQAKLRNLSSPPVILQKAKNRKRVSIDAKFFRNLLAILKIMVPSCFSSEVFYMALIAGALVCRTYCDVWMIKNGTLIESSIIGRNYHLFRKNLLEFILAIPAISIVNSLLKYSLSELKLRLRTRLTNHLYEQYLNGFTFYKMSNLDNRIANADQLLTQDVDKFCDSLVQLYSNISKPILDIFLYVYTLTSSIGYQGPALMLAYLVGSGLFLTKLRQPLGKMTVVEQELEGEFRYMNSRLIANSEEIAFYQGSAREKKTLLHSFQRLIAHLRKLVWFRFSLGFVENIITKYIATIVGFMAVSRPFMTGNNQTFLNTSHNEKMEHYYKSGRMLIKLAEAIGRLALAGREMNKLAGFTVRVTELVNVLNDLNKGHYVRTMIGQTNGQIANGTLPALLMNEKILPRLTSNSAGEIILCDNLIRFENVPLMTPNGDVLIEELNFEVKSGMNVLVCGPNGCGKSSLFRILGELWPLFGGKLTKPAKGNLFYIPQRPYMAVGTLRDQVLYPDTKEDMLRKNLNDGHLEKHLDMVQLKYILNRENGWDSVQDWMDVLSGGEKQRIAMARLFYHAPQFAILDECTSAVSVDVEGCMYQYCRQAGITLFTVSHRKSLWQHHSFFLLMDGRGSYKFSAIDEHTQQFGS